LRRPGLVFLPLPLQANGSLAVRVADPGESSADDLLVEALPIFEPYDADRPAVPIRVRGPHVHDFPEGQVRSDLLRPGPEGRLLLRAVDTAEPYLDGSLLVEDSDRVPIGNSDDLPLPSDTQVGVE